MTPPTILLLRRSGTVFGVVWRGIESLRLVDAVHLWRIFFTFLLPCMFCLAPAGCPSSVSGFLVRTGYRKAGGSGA